jgi:hypothetical protein
MEKSLADFKAMTSDSGKIPLDCIWYDVEEVRILLRKKTKKAVYNMVYRGQLPAYKMGGTLLFQRIEIDRLILANRVPGGPKSEPETFPRPKRKRRNRPKQKKNRK